jgi:hypothetical protein
MKERNPTDSKGKKKKLIFFLDLFTHLLGNPECFLCAGQQAVDQDQSTDNDDRCHRFP